MDWREEYEERAAIMEFDAGLSKKHAEQEAFKDIITQMQQSGIDRFKVVKTLKKLLED